MRWTQLLLVVTLLNTGACSYLLGPPGRSPQPSGNVPSLAELDSEQLLIGVVPGQAAFAVHLEAGTLYLPPDGRSALRKHRHRLQPLAPAERPGRDDRDAIARQLRTWLQQPVSAESLDFYRLAPLGSALIL